MTRDDIIRMAREAGMFWLDYGSADGDENMLERFAALVAAAEREACAKVCEENQFRKIEDDSCEPYNAGCRGSAAAIRARSEQEQPK